MLGGIGKSRPDLAWLQWITLTLGIAALIILSIIGRAIALMAMLSVIGIPFVFLLAAIPTLFLISLLTLVIALALKLDGAPQTALAFVAALGLLFLLPFADNRIGTTYVGHLVNDDRTPAIEPWSGRSIALIVPTGPNVECNSLCQKLLGRGLAQQVIVAAIPSKSTTLDTAEKTIAYSLEPRRPCKRPPSAYALDPALKLKLAQGACLVGEPSKLLKAEAVLWHRTIHYDSVSCAYLNPFKLPIAATRTSFYRLRGSTRHGEVWRQTSVSYATLWTLLVPTFVFNSPGFDVPAAGAQEVPNIEAFLQTQLNLNLAKQEVPDALLQLAAVDTILSQSAAYGGADPDRFATFAQELLSPQNTLDLPLDRVEALLKATVRDPRIPANNYLAGLSIAAYRKNPQTGDAVASALIGHLHTELAGGPDATGTRSRTVYNLNRALDAIPNQHFGRHWPRLCQEITTLAGADILATSIRRAWLANNPTPDLLAILNLQQTSRMNSDRRKNLLHPAMSALCNAALTGHAAPDTLPAFAALLHQPGFLPDSLPQTHAPALPDAVGVANTLAALGANREYILALKLHPYIASTLKPHLDQALRKPDCNFH